ncbi:MAG: hypothetical protein JJ920_08220 [Roseitalea sp.]|jgi:hypothetical protein|nr:hypothetical protein [Roseitalea sp.]MBO6721045.1 hypothetical protein [Roseitalea sp.]MBO6742883.1 hypothetical protein [Roseitalea sp.]
MASAPLPSYERRLILFLDFLGFREIVAEINDDPAALGRLIAGLNAVARIVEDGSVESERVTQFSDSLVVSYRVDETCGVFWLLHAMAMTVVELAGRGYLLRGAVTIGDLLHDDRHVVGPGMVAAYEMESQRAIMPRVIIDPAVLDIAREHRGDLHTPDDEEGYVRSFIAVDDDGEHFFDYVSWRSVVEIVGADDDSYGTYLAEISRLIERGLRHSDTRVLRKYLWLHRHYLAAIDLFEAIPVDHPYRAQSPENCEMIASLPRFDALCAAASASVAAEQQRS